MEKYQKHIISTDKNCTFLHRCFRDNIEGILKEGVICGFNPLSSMTWQPRKLEPALKLYHAEQNHGDSVIVVKLPRKLWEETHRKSSGTELLEGEIGYFSKEKKDFVVKPKFVRGWINRETNEFRENPYN